MCCQRSKIYGIHSHNVTRRITTGSQNNSHTMHGSAVIYSTWTTTEFEWTSHECVRVLLCNILCCCCCLILLRCHHGLLGREVTRSLRFSSYRNAFCRRPQRLLGWPKIPFSPSVSEFYFYVCSFVMSEKIQTMTLFVKASRVIKPVSYKTLGKK